ncbi:MAG: hypothetical protein ACJAZO_004931 [Myxococcota bacterium]|jgi:uncharacterized protein YbaR (Trm112 family)
MDLRAIPDRIRGLLVCPSCRGELRDEPGALVCDAEQLTYAVVEGVPHLVKELAKRYQAANSEQT